ncbi:MAG TPA: DUF998 domain-containing protein [Candidatus Methanofastidiosa archaeon]|nr:DUF998 domain-containing protein [Candidatus Methanofastidiosa archaeon]HPR42095.1 DUF998 domain-containing protein [Candidatus Methanofastidiosa archaeon]
MDPKTKYRLMLLSGASAISVPVISTAAISIAISKAEWFTWQDNWLSDLGVHSGSAAFFNSGLIISGILTVLVAIGMVLYLDDKPIFRMGKATFLVAGVSLMLIGVFTEDYSPYHYIVSVMFFVLSMISMLIVGIGYLIERKNVGAIFCILGIGGGTMWAIPWPGSAGAIPEATSIAFIIPFSVIMGIKMIGHARTRS